MEPGELEKKKEMIEKGVRVREGEERGRGRRLRGTKSITVETSCSQTRSAPHAT